MELLLRAYPTKPLLNFQKRADASENITRHLMPFPDLRTIAPVSDESSIF